MELSDITVEVRDKALRRHGLVRPEELILKLTGSHNNIGTWELQLSSEHPLTPILRTPGSGIVVTALGDVLMSGPTTTPKFTASSSDPEGTVSFSGVSDSIILADYLSWPEPSNVDPTAQTLAHDVREGAAETLMHAYVNANCGPGAPPARRKAQLVMGTDGQRGPTIKKSPRFPVLGNLLNEIATLGELGFQIVQRGEQLVFETFGLRDQALDVRLDVRAGTLASQMVALTAPGATQVIVAGQGDLVDRQFYAATTPEATEAEVAWGRRIERFLDQRQTDDPTEHKQAADELLSKEGFTGVSVQVVPTDDATMRYGIDWAMGDIASVVVDGGEEQAVVTGFVLAVDSAGVRLGAVLGDSSEFTRESALTARLSDVEKRTSALERNAENTTGVPAVVTAAITNAAATAAASTTDARAEAAAAVDDLAVLTFMGVY
ncbi:siphovirus ReqiPepy6 Gp37-like family protein [Rhodococcus antarcticus]|uniref:Siphovirus ReqiPepy6 Gp37-like family protein n=1 Tax=Rhodococcus antarcticus TaxID=2987751 RepID=A0ABY6NWV6_9NOCA|nr:siphovirus ReqiPepy6 Gp37-like family protein [Rhodococcus antarcticus]UZJ23719.1 siphovirus ReqiPepy6 Gp37-like family protein [Rhodococcus antarcticus]